MRRLGGDELGQRQRVAGEAGRGQGHHLVARLEVLDARADGDDLARALAAQRAGIAGIQIQHVQHVAEVQPGRAHPDFDLAGPRLLPRPGPQRHVVQLAARGDFQPIGLAARAISRLRRRRARNRRSRATRSLAAAIGDLVFAPAPSQSSSTSWSASSRRSSGSRSIRVQASSGCSAAITRPRPQTGDCANDSGLRPISHGLGAAGHQPQPRRLGDSRGRPRPAPRPGRRPSRRRAPPRSRALPFRPSTSRPER